MIQAILLPFVFTVFLSIFIWLTLHNEHQRDKAIDDALTSGDELTALYIMCNTCPLAENFSCDGKGCWISDKITRLEAKRKIQEAFKNLPYNKSG
jgi:hypothetical protein